MLKNPNFVSGLQLHLFSQPRFIRVLETGLVIMLAVLTGRLVADFLSFQDFESSSAVDESSAVASREQQSIPDTRRPPSPLLITLFGSPDGPQFDGIAAARAIEETRLKLILRGILVNRQTNRRLALIAIPGNVEQVYGIGDEIEGAEIVRIEPGRVILNHNGKNEALYLSIPKMEVDGGISTAGNRVVPAGYGIRRINNNQTVVSEQTLRQQLNNLPGLLRQAKAVPHQLDGENVGFKIVELQAGSVFEDLGIKTEDIIQSVNGTPLRSTEDALNIYRRLRTSKSLQVGVLRDGRAVTLDFTVQ